MSAATQDAGDPGAALAVIEISGETIDLRGPDEGLVEGLKMVDGYISALQGVRKTINDELLVRIDRTAKFSGTLGGEKFSAPSPDAVAKYNENALADAMKTLVEDGVIDMPAFDAAFSREVKLTMPDSGWQALRPWVERNLERGVKFDVKWKLGRMGLKAILKVGGKRARNLVESHEIDPGPRRVKVGS